MATDINRSIFNQNQSTGKIDEIIADMTQFGGRKEIEIIATKIFLNWLNVYGIPFEKVGVQEKSEEICQELRRLNDKTSNYVRHGPDFLSVLDFRSLFWELKGEGLGRPNFAVEARSWDTIWDIDKVCGGVAWAFVNITNMDSYMPSGDVFCCWTKDIPIPQKIVISRQHKDYNENYQYFKEKWPSIIRDIRDKESGSGTPYFLLSKEALFLIPMDTFINSVRTQRQQALF